MNISELLVASIAGTSLMTLFMYLMSFLTDYKTKVINVLGTLLTFQTKPSGELSYSPLAVAVGTVAHYAVGFAFALAYGWLWSEEVLQPNLWGILILGTVSGILAVIFWWSFFKIHPKSPDLKLSAYLTAIFLAHYFFVAGVVWCYNFLRS
ncbi:hypothetical protein [Siphonobacter curvatus]|uniref:DUF2938 domain-containing protein n=1 Tax=Siphonobacter curvatus TaxID=2094562 RepID=A0A2S7IP68_9BACT|nr:hypothetical protein [Siphonobacter curvatus]PQA59523.1 hypothetical protein C5O19_07710 [Siphonobacter curvatus]